MLSWFCTHCPPKTNWCLAAQHGDVVVEGECVVVEFGDRVGAAADGEFIGDGELQTIRFGLVENDAERIALMSFAAYPRLLRRRMMSGERYSPPWS